MTAEEKKKEDEDNNNNILLDKVIESWKSFGYILCEENSILFNKMLSECRAEEYANKAVNAKGEYYSAESLFMLLIFQQQKIIKRLIEKLTEKEKEI
jgi:hypothetical protein